MSTETTREINPDVPRLSVKEARDSFSELVNRAVYAGEVTFVTRGRSKKLGAAIVPEEWVRHYEDLLDGEDIQIALERLADIDAGREELVSSEEARRILGL